MDKIHDSNGYPKLSFKKIGVEGASTHVLNNEHTIVRTEGYNRMVGGVNYRFQCSCGFDQETTGKTNRPAQSHMVKVLELMWSAENRRFE